MMRSLELCPKILTQVKDSRLMLLTLKGATASTPWMCCSNTELP